MAHQIDVDIERIIEMVSEGVKERLHLAIVKLLLEDEDAELYKGGVSRQLESLVTESFRRGRRALKFAESGTAFLRSDFSTPATLVGIGAPIHLFLPDVADALGAPYCIPENAAVANAVGAITGNVMAEETVLVRPRYSIAGITGYLAFSSMENRTFPEHDDAIAWAKSQATDLAGRSAVDRGAEDFEITLDVDRNEAEISGVFAAGGEYGHPRAGSLHHIETLVTARATGKVAGTMID